MPPQPTVLRADAAGVALQWRAPDFSLLQVTGDDGRPYIAVETPGWTQTEEPGQPQLPVGSALAVVPPTGDVTLRVETLERARRPLPHPVVPARAPVPVGDPPTHIESAWARDEGAYTGAGPRPADVVTLEEVGWLRGRRLVRLTYYPLRFDPAGGALEVARRVRVELHFANKPPDDVADEAANDPFASVLQDSVVNPAQVTRFARPERPAPAPDEVVPAPTLPDPPDGADYLIIAHSDLIEAVAPLANHRATVDGLRVFSTTVEAIYDAYSGGVVTHTAIKDYVAHAYENWTPSPTYVLLVGDGIEPEDELTRSQRSDANPNYVPPYPIEVVPYPSEGLVASDNRYVTVDGDDNLADLFIGRLPVNSVAETTTVVDKILAYELSPPRWPWNERVLFFAGDESDNYYHEYSDDVYRDHLPSGFTGRRVYFCTSGCDQPHEYDDITAAHDATLRELNAGGLLASYWGHSSPDQWDADPVTGDPLFHVDTDVPSLHNGGALPVILEMTCVTSRFGDPHYDTLDESLVRRAGGGAVATWGPSTLASTGGHRILHPKLFDAVFQTGTTGLGPATEAAKAHLPDDLSYMRDTYILLGDPATELNLDVVAWTDVVFLPLALRDG